MHSGKLPLSLSLLTRLSVSVCSRLVSTDGYAVVDDTHRPQFDNASWPWLRNISYPQPAKSQCTTIAPEQVNVCVCVCVWYSSDRWVHNVLL